MFHSHHKGILTPTECNALITLGRLQGFEPSLVNQGDGTQKMMTHVRNNERAIFDNVELAKALEEKLQILPDFPQVLQSKEFHSVASHFRLYKYSPGQYFKPHRDGSFELNRLETEVTVLFYLNDTDGGETVLMPYGKQQEWAHIAFTPKQGDVLMFEHHCLHAGYEVKSGEKYVLRTDLFYTPSKG